MENEDIIRKEIAGINDKLTDIVYAIKGSGMTGDGGLVKKIDRIELRQNEMDREIKAWKEAIGKELGDIKNRNTKFDTYQKIVWACIGSGSSIFLAYLMTVVIK